MDMNVGKLWEKVRHREAWGREESDMTWWLDNIIIKYFKLNFKLYEEGRDYCLQLLEQGWAHRRFQHPAETPDMVSGDKIPRCALADFLAHKLPEHHKWSFYTNELESNVLCGHRHCHSPLEENESGEAQPFPALRLETNFSHVSSLRENREARN